MPPWYLFCVAGIVAGLVEVAWIGAWSVHAGPQAAAVAGAVSATVFPGSAGLAIAPWLGLAIHLFLSVALALGFGKLVWPLVRHRHAGATMLASVLVLALVWKVNFFILLPAWNAGFVELLPLAVTLASKLMFGAAMGLVLAVYEGRQRHATA